MKHDRAQRAAVRAEVRRLLTRSPSYRGLPEASRARLASGMVRVAMSVVDARDPATTSREIARALDETASGRRDRASGRDALRASLAARGDRPAGVAGAVDFPAFVAGLVQGVFQSVVGASIQQMEAYAELLHDVAVVLDDFVVEEEDDDDDDD